jgi:hypothetical protein
MECKTNFHKLFGNVIISGVGFRGTADFAYVSGLNVRLLQIPHWAE